jgi:putative ABC transport system permease protein
VRLSRQHFRLAARSFSRHPGFSIVAVLSLALAIALNTTMYSVIDSLVNPRLDVKDPEGLYWLTIWGDFRHKVDEPTRASLLRSGFNAYEAVTLYNGSGNSRQVAVEYKRQYQQVATAVVAPNFFNVLGARPTAGRTFTDTDVNAETQPVVITDGLAHALFTHGESPIGKVIDIDGAPAPIVGVVSGAAHLPERTADLYQLPAPGSVLSNIPSNVVRLRKGVSIAAADNQLHVLSARFATLLGVTPKDVWFQLSPMKRPQFRIWGFHYALIGAVVAVLLVACANLANLQLARGIGRSRELALRAALGATRGDIIGQLVLESALLAGAGLVLGLVMTFWSMSLLASRIPPRVAMYITAPQTSWRVFAFAMVASVVCVMLVGLLPALRVSHVDPNELLKSGAGTGANKKNRRQYGIMVVAEIGLSLVLLSGAAILVRSAIRLESVKLALDIKPLSLAWLRWTTPRDAVARYADISSEFVSRVRGLPDVDDAAVVFLRGASAATAYGTDGVPRSIGANGYKIVSPSYVRTMHLQILKGRSFLDGYSPEAEVIVDQKSANALWPGVDPIGKQIKLGSVNSREPWVRVVGLAANLEDPAQLITSRASGMRSAPLGAVYYLPTANDSLIITIPKGAPPTWTRGFVFQIVTRSKSDHERMPITLRHYLREMGPTRLVSVDRMDAEVWIERASHDFVAAMFSAFATLAIGLAALGIYGVVSHSVAERKREIGVRIALGATARDVLHAVLREGNAMALSGVALGLLLTKYSVGWLQAFSLEDDIYDAPLFAMMAAVLFTVAVLSALAPALRATRIDPVESLRSE